MDISLLSQSSIKIRGKTGSLIVDPEDAMPKNNADGVLFQNPKSQAGVLRVLDCRIFVHGMGDYEVSGIKISAVGGRENLVYRLTVDEVSILLTKATEIVKDDKINSCDILLLNVDSNFDESMVAKIDPKITILYGAGTKEALKQLGKENTAAVKKFSTAKDKLPAEMEVIVLN